MKTLIALCLAVVGLVGVAAPQANAHEIAPVVVQTTTALPANPRVNLTVVVGGHRRHYRTVRRVYYRHGRRVVVYRRVYY